MLYSVLWQKSYEAYQNYSEFSNFVHVFKPLSSSHVGDHQHRSDICEAFVRCAEQYLL